MLRCLPSLLGLFLGLLPFTTGTAQELTDALSVRSLAAEQAKEGRPVRLRATVGFLESPATVFVQDDTAGTFLRAKKLPVEIHEGDIVEVEGKTFPGLFLPGIELGSVQVVGHGEPPKAQPASYDDLASARFHYQRVSVEGIVRSVAAREENRSVLKLALGSRVLEVRVESVLAEDSESLVDARVRVTGLAAGTINDRRQMVQPYVKISTWAAVRTLEPGRPAEEIATATTESLLHFSTAGDSGHRVRVEGTVTGVFHEGLVFMRDGEASVAVQVADASSLRVGQRVTVEGFPLMDRFTPTLADVRLAHAEDGAAPEALAMKLAEMPRRAHEADLITVSGTVVDSYRSGDGQTLVLTDNGVRLPARLAAGAAIPMDLHSQVELTGICRVESFTGKGFNAVPQSFSLWLRSAQDVRLVKSPPPWTVERLLTALGVLTLLVLAGMVWIFLLRRQVSAQTLALRAGIQHEAALEERQRIAREFHDTLEQELAGLSLRLDAAATRPLDDKAKGLLDTSRSLVSRIQIEARNLVSDLRDDPDSQVELSAALQDLVQRQPANAPLIQLVAEGVLPPLPSHVAHHLRMMAQEAVTNALKHAQACTIQIALRATDGGVELSVTDDGVGFNPDASTLGKPGHFGCMGIRERCRKIGADVTWTSNQGKGTTMRVTYMPSF